MRQSRTWLLFFLVSAQVAGIAGSVLVGGVDSWYLTLDKAPLNPPGWIFAPVWTTLYLLMGIAGYFLWQERNTRALKLYWLQLVLNALWTPLFFGLHAPVVALLDLVILDILVAILIGVSSKRAAVLLIPYLLWISFATYLNLMIVLLN